jgi:hypothetical protein
MSDNVKEYYEIVKSIWNFPILLFGSYCFFPVFRKSTSRSSTIHCTTDARLQKMVIAKVIGGRHKSSCSVSLV